FEDLQKARAKTDKIESAKVLAEARQCFDQNKLDEAESLCYRAERLHGPYTMWDGGDRPQKILAEIQTARAKGKKSAPTAVAHATDEKKAAAPTPAWPDDAKSGILQTSASVPDANPMKEQSRRLMNEGKEAMKGGQLLEARSKFL